MARLLTSGNRNILLGFLITSVVVIALLIVYWSLSHTHVDDLQVEESDEVGMTQLAQDYSPSTTQSNIKSHQREFWDVAVNQSDEALPSYLRNPPDAARLMSLKDTPTNWVIGTAIGMSVPWFDEGFQLIVDRMQEDHKGNKNYRALGTSEAGEKLVLIATVTGKLTLVFLKIGTHSFELTAFEDKGWLIPTASLGEHVDYSVSDLGSDPLSRYSRFEYLGE